MLGRRACMAATPPRRWPQDLQSKKRMAGECASSRERALADGELPPTRHVLLWRREPLWLPPSLMACALPQARVGSSPSSSSFFIVGGYTQTVLVGSEKLSSTPLGLLEAN